MAYHIHYTSANSPSTQAASGAVLRALSADCEAWRFRMFSWVHYPVVRRELRTLRSYGMDMNGYIFIYFHIYIYTYCESYVIAGYQDVMRQQFPLPVRVHEHFQMGTSI